MSETHKIPSAEVVPLADRMRYMQAFRFLAGAGRGMAVGSPQLLETGVKVLVAVTASTCWCRCWAMSRACLLARRSVHFTAMLLSDGVYRRGPRTPP